MVSTRVQRSNVTPLHDGSSEEEFVVQKGVPIRAGRVRSKYPWASMEVGDSFFATGVSRAGLHSCAIGWALRHSPAAKFSTDYEDDGVRIWRVK